ncbi:poly a -specific ribonuclease/target of egr1 member 1 [Holotrichia oblita]|uniref:Poly a -specific ribonuclease/target of egr1 member 1 n=1 Tax=Holotrichia oblita TaxID=644536 RepID=A0ACB9SS48_HOLOL|nr:poly a -specific ribonuclease/target of egr1 member 1 [Holotrichia oblita]
MCDMLSSLKRIRTGDPDFEEVATRWFEEVRDNRSDIDDCQSDDCKASEHDSDSNLSTDGGCDIYDKSNKCFKQEAYNFYIFPRAIPKYVSDQRFLCQVSSIDFLVSQGFDFNKLFRHGISYLNSVQESKYREALNETQKIRLQNSLGGASDSTNRVTATKEADKEFLKNISDQIKSFLDSSEEELVLPRCNGFLRLLIYQLVRENFDKKIDIRTKSENRDRLLVITKFKSIDDRKEELQKLMQEEEADLENTIGFTKVVKLIMESGKLMVGHNMVLDLLHTIDKFLTPLPEDYEEFKECTHCLFPKIIDTKFLSASEPFSNLISSNVLQHLLETVSKSPFSMPKIEVEDDSCGYSLSDRKEHEAGYDAYITGVCFLSMWQYLGQKNMDKGVIFENFHLLKPYMNKQVPLINASYISNLCFRKLTMQFIILLYYKRVKVINTNPSRDHVFYLTFPKEWKSSDISLLFSPFGSVHISWINESSAYVGLMKKQEAAVALSTLSQSDTYTITSWAKRQSVLAGLPTIPKSPLIVRKKSSDGHMAKRRRICDKNIHLNTSIDPVIESSEVDEELVKTNPEKKENPETIPIIKASRKRTISKTFQEDNSWE